MKVKAYTDGACSGNPGPGGWGVYLIAENNVGEVVKAQFGPAVGAHAGPGAVGVAFIGDSPK